MYAARRAGATIWLVTFFCFAVARALAPVGLMPSFAHVGEGYISFVICHESEAPGEQPTPRDDRDRCPYAAIAHAAFTTSPAAVSPIPPVASALVLSTIRDHVASAQRHAPTIGARGPPLLLI